MKKEKIKILVDDRERGVLNEELEKLGIECESIRLTVGDYVYMDGEISVLIERKTIDDFCASILDGRIEHQIDMMKIMSKNRFIIISGRISDRTSEIDENCLLGKITSLIVKHGIGVVMVDNDKQMAYVIKSIVEKVKNKII